MLSRLLYRIALFVIRVPKPFLYLLLVPLVVIPLVGTVTTKIYQHWDNDADRGAIAIEQGFLTESYVTPEYLDQGWDTNASLWFYNTSQGSAMLPYEFLLALELPDKVSDRYRCERQGEKDDWLLCPKNMDFYRYLPQKNTFFNPDALPVGFVKESYQGQDYVGLTCAACHTSQVNYQGRALRIDGGPAMADMMRFLADISTALADTQRKPDQDNPRLTRFTERVLAYGDNFDNASEVEQALNEWAAKTRFYNVMNHPTTDKCFGGDPLDPFKVEPCVSATGKPISKTVDYGYARLDAFGRIYNRVLQHAINIEQLEKKLKATTKTVDGQSVRVLNDAEVSKVLEGIGRPGDAILRDHQFAQIVANLTSGAPGYPKLSETDMLRIRNKIFNPANAPVSYPFLWDITHSDYVQWNGLAGNSQLGPLGRNAGEVIGVFAMLDWHTDTGLSRWLRDFSLSAILSGQKNKDEVVNFKSSVDLFNLQRLESHLMTLTSPAWPFCKSNESSKYYLPNGPVAQAVDLRACAGNDQRIDMAKVDQGKVLYAEKCQRCHVVIDPKAHDRLMVSSMLNIQDSESTDRTMAQNSVSYTGSSGNFKDTYQATEVGNVVIKEEAPVVQILTSATKGVVATADPDKWFFQRIYDWGYALVMSLRDNPIKDSIKVGNYEADTTSHPYASLESYRARSLNGIWATAPYLHNGSVPSLYDLLSCVQDRPTVFQVGAREFDPVKVGFISDGYDGFKFNTRIVGNSNHGHDYGSCAMTDVERYALIEYLKTL